MRNINLVYSIVFWQKRILKFAEEDSTFQSLDFPFFLSKKPIFQFENFILARTQKRLRFITRLYNHLIGCVILAEKLDTKSHCLRFNFKSL